MIKQTELLEFEGFKFRPFSYSIPSIKLLTSVMNNEEPSQRTFVLIRNVAEKPEEVLNKIGKDDNVDLPFFTRLSIFLSENYTSKMYPKITILPDKPDSDEDSNDGTFFTDEEYKLYEKLNRTEPLLPVKISNVLYLFKKVKNFNDSMKIFNLSTETYVNDYGVATEILKKYEVTGNLDKLGKNTFEYYAFHQIIRLFLTDFTNIFNETYEKKS